MVLTNKSYKVDYRLELENGSSMSYEVEISKDNYISKAELADKPPEWTKLENNKCSNCTLSGSEYCPVALRLANPVQRFAALVSHAPTTTTVTTPERTYLKKVDVQEALRSLFGLIMATSGCPSMKPFKFMARYHMPFASIEETISRITATYLLRQLFKNPGAMELPIDLSEIDRLYATMQTINDHMARRLRQAETADGTMNAIVILSAYSSVIPIVIKKELMSLKPLFE